MKSLNIPCDRCGEPRDYHLHEPSSACAGCLAPRDHHVYRPNAASLEAAAEELAACLLKALQVLNDSRCQAPGNTLALRERCRLALP